jgi:hypothetical protein
VEQTNWNHRIRCVIILRSMNGLIDEYKWCRTLWDIYPLYIMLKRITVGFQLMWGCVEGCAQLRTGGQTTRLSIILHLYYIYGWISHCFSDNHGITSINHSAAHQITTALFVIFNNNDSVEKCSLRSMVGVTVGPRLATYSELPTTEIQHRPIVA